MATKFQWALAAILTTVGANANAVGAGLSPVAIKGVEYRAENVQETADAPLKAWVKAVDPRTSAELWRVKLYEGTSRSAWLQGPKNPKVIALEAFAHGLVVKVDDGATFFVDIATHKSEIVRDMRTETTTCPAHHRQLEGRLVPIHYGLSTRPLLTQEERDKYPLADRPVNGGCCVMDEKSAIVNGCHDCR